MAITECILAGRIVAPDSSTPATLLTLYTMPGAYGTSDSEAVMGSAEYILTDGEPEADAVIWAGMKYRAELTDGSSSAPSEIYIAVPESAAGTTIYWHDLLAASQVAIEMGRFPVYRDDDLEGSLSSGDAPDGYRATSNGNRQIVWRAPGAGAGDMQSDVYDPQNKNADAFARANHTGTQTLSTISDAGNAAGKNVGTIAGTVAAGDHAHDAATSGAAGFMSAADKSKLDGVQSGATVNATDASLRDRTTHTGTQAISTVAGLQAALDAAGMTLVIDQVAHRAAAGSLSQIINVGAFRTRIVNTLLTPGETGIVLGSGATANLFILTAGTYMWGTVLPKYAYVARFRTRLRSVNLASPLQLDPNNPFEWYSHGNVSTSLGEIETDILHVPTFTLTADTWFTIESDVATSSGDAYDGGYNGTSGSVKADGVTLVPEEFVLATFAKVKA